MSSPEETMASRLRASSRSMPKRPRQHVDLGRERLDKLLEVDRRLALPEEFDAGRLVLRHDLPERPERRFGLPALRPSAAANRPSVVLPMAENHHWRLGGGPSRLGHAADARRIRDAAAPNFNEAHAEYPERAPVRRSGPRPGRAASVLWPGRANLIPRPARRRTRPDTHAHAPVLLDVGRTCAGLPGRGHAD